MDNSSRRSGRSDRAPGWRRISLTLLAASLACCLSLAVLLGEATGALALLPGAMLQAPVAQAQANATGVPGQPNAPTPTPTMQPPTATPPPATPTLAILSPTSKEGPVGAHISLKGSHWGAGATVTITGVNGGSCSVAPSGQSLTTTQATNSGSITATFLWPSSLGSVGTTYIICATNNTAAIANGIPYTVLSSAPPTISLSVSSVPVGGVVSISGSNFAGAQSVIVSSENTSSVIQKIRTVGVGGDGSFVTQFTPTAADAGPLNISAATPAQNGATPALQATAQLTVPAATTPTITTTVSPTTTAAAGGGGNTQNTNSSGPSLGLILVLVVAILLVVLLIVGLIVLVAMRRRRGAGPQGPDGAYGQGDYDPYSGQGGYGATGRQSAYGQYGQSGANGPTGRYGAVGQPGQGGQYGQYGQYGRPGVYNNQGAPGDPYAPTIPNGNQAIGGVAQWGDAEADPEPDPNWRPSPMTGGRRFPEDFDDDANGNAFMYPDLSPAPGQQLPPGASNAPDDPWGDASGGFIPGGAYRPPTNRPGVASEDPPIYGGMPPRNSGRYEATDSQGSTRPTGPTMGMPPSLYPPRNPPRNPTQRSSGGPPGGAERQGPADPNGRGSDGSDGW